MRTEFSILSGNKTIKLDDGILNEDSITTPRIEIEGYLDGILIVIDFPKEKLSEDKIGLFTKRFIKFFSWMFGIIYFYEKTEKTYFENCFKKLEGFENNAAELYRELKRFDNDKTDPQKIVELILIMYFKCFDIEK